MEIHGGSTPGISDASAELRGAKLAKDMQEEQGKQTLQLLDSATDVPKATSHDMALGSHVDTFA